MTLDDNMIMQQLFYGFNYEMSVPLELLFRFDDLAYHHYRVLWRVSHLGGNIYK